MEPVDLEVVSSSSEVIREPAGHRTRSRRSPDKFRALQVVPHPNRGPRGFRPYRGPWLFCAATVREGPVALAPSTLAHLLHRHAPAVVQVLVRATLRDHGSRRSPPMRSDRIVHTQVTRARIAGSVLWSHARHAAVRA